MTRMIGRAAGTCTLATAVLVSSLARGEGVVDRCVDANTQAQSLRNRGKLAEARTQLKFCADPSCPALVRDDCAQLLDDLDRAQPTIVFDVKDDAGRDLVDVNVGIDGRPFARSLEGVALPADPGAHTFTFEAAGRSPVATQIVVREGEKNRREVVVLKGPTPSGTIAPPPPALSPAAHRPVEGYGAQRVAALVLGGLGAAALGAGGALAVWARSKSDDANAFCPGKACSNPQALSLNRQALTSADAATVVLIVGAVGVASGAALWWTAPSAGGSGLAVGLVGTGLSLRRTW
jgi:hypothetical protein